MATYKATFEIHANNGKVTKQNLSLSANSKDDAKQIILQRFGHNGQLKKILIVPK